MRGPSIMKPSLDQIFGKITFLFDISFSIKYPSPENTGLKRRPEEVFHFKVLLYIHLVKNLSAYYSETIAEAICPALTSLLRFSTVWSTASWVLPLGCQPSDIYHLICV